jgi:hypothetical protein
MLDRKETVESAKEQAELATWEQPEVRRIDAGEAETGGGFGVDGGFS